MPKTIYNMTICQNVECPVGEFIPNRSDQKYCDNKCRSHHNRLKNREKTTLERTENNELKRIDRALEKMHVNCSKNNIQTLPEDAFKSLDISLTKAVYIDRDEITGNKINWFYEFGIMAIAKGQYKIVKKSDDEN